MKGIKSLTFANKPTLFIASSGEGLFVAKAIKDRLQDLAVVDIWDEEEIFSEDKNFLNSLLNLSSFYDYAIMVLTADDQLTKRAEEMKTARDNVIFEFGLFLGRIGPNRAFGICEKGLALPSDFFEVEMIQFERGDFEASIDRAIAQIIPVLEGFAFSYEFSLLPSTTLAIGYYKNFVEKIATSLQKRHTITLMTSDENREINLKEDMPKIRILLPDTLEDIHPDSAIFKRLTEGRGKVMIPTDTRPFPFYIRTFEKDKGVFDLYDIPTTLLGSYFAIQKLFDDDFLGKKDRRRTVDQKEILNFEKTLRILIPDELEDVVITIEKMSDLDG